MGTKKTKKTKENKRKQKKTKEKNRKSPPLVVRLVFKSIVLIYSRIALAFSFFYRVRHK